MAASRETVTAAARGDRRAFAELVESESTMAYRVAYGILGGHAEAEDAAQDAFIRAWRDLPTLRDPDRWSAWFRRLVVRSALDRAKGSRRRPTVPLDSIEGHDGEPRGLDLLGPVAGHDALLRALAGLSPDDRAVIALRFGADLAVPDIATALGIPLGTAKARVSRAVARLRARMGDDR
jgi:RNA polymerase sigma-70 factor (ECF subfamily)